MTNAEKRLHQGLQEGMEQQPFGFAAYSEKAAESTGFSNYAYWGSTIKVFLKNRTATALLPPGSTWVQPPKT